MQKNSQIILESGVPQPRLVSFDKFLRSYGKTRQTGHRWRRLMPWLDAAIVNVFGRLYLPIEAVQKFEEMAAAGQLAIHLRPPPPPPKGPRGPRGRKTKSQPS